jgi:extradiol dioxygenase family protein
MSQFHYSFHTRDLAEARRFYGDLLGCREGRSTATWVDFDFFGNQISIHLGEPVATSDTGRVDGIAVPMPHFGAILSWEDFAAAAARLRAAGVGFIIEPVIRYPGAPGEQITMFLRDLGGNALEFKAFRHPEHVFTA